MEFCGTTAESFLEQLFALCRQHDGEAFTVRVRTGTYQQRFFRNEETGEWLSSGVLGMEELRKGTEIVQTVLEQYPELSAKYPQETVTDTRETTAESQALRTMNGYAEISVPVEFSASHSGAAFRKMLDEKWQSQTEKLLQNAAKKIRRYEIKTAALFYPDNSLWNLPLFVEQNSLSTTVWKIPYAACDLYPMMWDHEICGMASLLTEKLPPLLESEKMHVSALMRRDAAHQRCIIELNIKEEHP